MAQDPAEDRWQDYTSASGRKLTIQGVFALLAALALAAWLAGTGPQAAARDDGQDRPPTLCQEHADRPGWAEVCKR
jgi:hypothetical protein